MNCKFLVKRIGYFYCKKQNINTTLSQCNKCLLVEQTTPNYGNYATIKKSVLNRTKKPLKQVSKKDTNNSSIMPKSNYYCNYKVKYAHKHHCIGGRNRNNSEKYGLFIWVSAEQHKYIHDNPDIARLFKQEAQKQWELYYGSRDEFIKIFGESFIA